ncbi:MAG: hypothetical protein K2K86_02180, partial [Muribaculaceae bacterium]|nr:hypothetical protein [Muribaculaceae bacterium]
TSSLQSIAYETPIIEFETPAGFVIDTISDLRYVVEKDSAIAFIHFHPISNIDGNKVISAHDSVFFNINDYTLLEDNIEGNADVINKYLNTRMDKFVKIYRYVHGDGYSTIYAVNEVDDFAWADEIDKSFHRGSIPGALLIAMIVSAIICIFFGYHLGKYFNKNWPRFIVCALISLIGLIPFVIIWSWEGVIIWGCVLFLGIAFGKGYYIIPI